MALGAIGLLYMLNLVALIVQSVVMCSDKAFREWNLGPSKCATVVVSVFSTVFSHKFRNIIFCKLFSLSILSARMENVGKLRVFYVFSFLSLVSSGGAIFAAAVGVSRAIPNSQMFYECIDVIVITGLMIVLAFFNVIKPDDFFEERTPDGYHLNKKFEVDSDGIENRLHPAGEDGEAEHGQYSKIQHAMTSNQPFKVDFTNSSMESLSVKQYEEISVQAYEIIDRKGLSSLNGINQPKIPTPKFSTPISEETVHNAKPKSIPAMEDRSSQRTVFYKKEELSQGRSPRAEMGVQNYQPLDDQTH